jgi:hypothetical protein
MTVEQMLAALEDEGWRVWNLQQGTKGTWTCRLYEPMLGDRTNGQRGPTGYDRECWRVGAGPTMLAAMSAAALGLFGNHQPQMEEPLDLAAMLS